MKTILLYFKYIVWLLKEIALSSIKVTRIIWSRNLNVSPVTGFVSLRLKKDLSKVCFANSITLTPGTITLFVEKNKILVHSLTQEGLDLDNMHNNIIRTFEC